ncbi:MAG: RNA methyltransferase [Flavobacteriales bacterium]|jgi:tRNA (guanosine-2'-O-)-methyltransferase|nr:RNA methyltransferase [Flavobacteriales bacterium]MCB0759645.1 RNA methyltransferase [Flavobacteriales bacterium]
MVTDAERYAQLAPFITDNKRELFERIAHERTRHVTVVLEDIFQPHNASAVVRTAELLGVQDLHIIENRNTYTVNPDVTLGSSKWTDMIRYRDRERDNAATCASALRAKGYRIVATSPTADSVTPESIPLDTPMAFCFGTELTGLSEGMMAHADTFLRIPMHGFTESYNISVSAAIVLYTVMQRLRNSDVQWRLSEQERDALKLSWARRTVRSAQQLEARFDQEAQDPSVS